MLLLEVVELVGTGGEVVTEATCGCYWAVDLLSEAGFRCIWRTRPATTGATGG